MKNDYYTLYSFNPTMTFDDYFVSIGGLIGLWNGLSLYDLKFKIILLINCLLLKFENIKKLVEKKLVFRVIHLFKENLKVRINLI